MLSHLLQTRLAPTEGSRDMVILVHEMEVEYPRRELAPECLVYTMVEEGDPLAMSAMAKTVGLPTAIAIEMLLTRQLKLRGCQIPTHPEICDAVLAKLKAEGLKFTESVEKLPAGGVRS